MPIRSRVLAALSTLFLVALSAVSAAPANTAERDDNGRVIASQGIASTSEFGTLDFDSNPQVTRNGGTVSYVNFRAARGSQSPYWFPYDCPRGYVCLYTPYKLDSTYQHWRMWKLYDYGQYDIHGFVYNGVSYLTNNQTGGGAAWRTDGGAIDDPIAPKYCPPRTPPTRHWFATNYYPAWGVFLSSGVSSPCYQ
jgi:hypothetical protein